MRGRGDEGQATVELALMLPFLVLMVLLVVQFGLVVRDRLELAHVARVAARTAVEDPTPSAVTAAARGASDLDPSRLRVTVSGGRSVGDTITVVVRYTSLTNVPVAGALVPNVLFSERLSAEVG
jgi:Flp pilus assembly protein TadG